jgi:hypothetical protein
VNERQVKITQLLGSLHDHLPGLKGSLRTSSGLTANERVACPGCAHLDEPGWTVDRFKRRTPCVSCGGAPEPTGKSGNWRKSDGGRGWVSVDPMDADRRPVQTVTEAAPPTRPPRMVTCDACGGTGAGIPHIDLDTGREWRDPCRRCNGGGKRSVVTVPPLMLGAEDPGDDARLEHAIDRRRRLGSYHELEDALGWLPPLVRSCTVWVYGYGGDVAEHHSDLPELGLGLLDRLMPAVIRVPADVRAAEKRRAEHMRRVKGLARSNAAVLERDREIRRMIRRGRPTQWVAGEFGLSVRRVNEIVAGETAAA